MNTLYELESPDSTQDTSTPKSPKYRRRHEPVVIHTINPALGPLSSRALNRAGTMSPMTPSTPFSSHPSRPRADSTAARMATEVTEAMIQERLDQLTRRLDVFNQQSFDLYTRTQQLAAEFQAKSKRLYQVEDHLLKIQGKPGLSDDFLAHGPQPRRLTNDLEELRMGVKTLRKKFQMAGSVVATVGWWQHLKQNSTGESLPGTGKPLTPMRTFSKKKEKLSLEKIFTNSIPEAISEQSPNEARHLHASPVHEVKPVLGLRSPPLTPKGPLSGSSLLVGPSLETKGEMSVLPIIPDNDIEVTTPTIAMMATPSLPLDAMLEKTPGTTNSDETNGSGFTEEEPPVPVPALLSACAHSLLPSPSAILWSEEVGEAIENNAQEPEPEPELNEPNVASESHPTQQDSKDEEGLVIYRESEKHDFKASESSPARLVSGEMPEALPVNENAELSDVNEAPLTETDAEDQAKDQDKADQESVDKDAQDKSDTFTSASFVQEVQEGPDTWVQAFWRFLIRIEYFLLGTAVLGAMMPDNVYALCAGFSSALMYASLLIYHRVAAPPGSEAPKPPTGTRRVDVAPSGSQSRWSSRYQTSLKSRTSIKTE
ncbi:hypothetical protein BG003_006458 [Podila horticola]|nr:hypothetical protein BG003_006458 [Podila horticola]